MVKSGGAGWLPGLRLLVSKGGDLNASFRNYRPLHALIQEKPHGGRSADARRLACLEWMLEHGADPEEMGAWPSARGLVVAAFQGDRACVKAIRQRVRHLDVFTAAALGESAKLEKILGADSGLSQARDGGLLTALQCAAGSRLGAGNARAARGLLECARLLVDSGADVNAWTKSWSHEVAVSYFVIRSGQVEMLKYLLSAGMNPTDALAAAAWDHREDLLDVLIAHGARVDDARDHLKPVLNELVRWGQFDAARTYLRKGASPNLKDERGWTALHQGVSRGNLNIVRDLVAAGADPNIAADDGRTPRGMAKKKAGRMLALLDRHET